MVGMVHLLLVKEFMSLVLFIVIARYQNLNKSCCNVF
jgi:hypothetical protein